VANVKTHNFSILTANSQKHVIHTLLKSQSKDVERYNLVPNKNLNSFVPHYVKGNVLHHHQHHHQQMNVVHVKIRIHSDLKANTQNHVIRMLLKNPTNDVENMLILIFLLYQKRIKMLKELNFIVQQPVKGNAGIRIPQHRHHL
jgi:hypothetical protein